jgi:hypothetical protein
MMLHFLPRPFLQLGDVCAIKLSQESFYAFALSEVQAKRFNPECTLKAPG